MSGRGNEVAESGQGDSRRGKIERLGRWPGRGVGWKLGIEVSVPGFLVWLRLRLASEVENGELVQVRTA